VSLNIHHENFVLYLDRQRFQDPNGVVMSGHSLTPEQATIGHFFKKCRTRIPRGNPSKCSAKSKFYVAEIQNKKFKLGHYLFW
jgi:hypothetical protein